MKIQTQLDVVSAEALEKAVAAELNDDDDKNIEELLNDNESSTDDN